MIRGIETPDSTNVNTCAMAVRSAISYYINRDFDDMTVSKASRSFFSAAMDRPRIYMSPSRWSLKPPPSHWWNYGLTVAEYIRIINDYGFIYTVASRNGRAYTGAAGPQSVWVLACRESSTYFSSRYDLLLYDVLPTDVAVPSTGRIMLWGSMVRHFTGSAGGTTLQLGYYNPNLPHLMFLFVAPSSSGSSVIYAGVASVMRPGANISPGEIHVAMAKGEIPDYPPLLWRYARCYWAVHDYHMVGTQTWASISGFGDDTVAETAAKYLVAYLLHEKEEARFLSDNDRFLYLYARPETLRMSRIRLRLDTDKLEGVDIGVNLGV